MLIEQYASLPQDVGELSLDEIKTRCLTDFAGNLEKLLRSWDGKGGTFNYKTYDDAFCSKIKYNSKSIIYEETISNKKGDAWTVEETCVNCYGLVPSNDTSTKYELAKDLPTLCMPMHVCEYGEPSRVSDENLCNFYKYFGLGEFPFITITLIRLGNKDHYLYHIHR